MGRRAVKTGVQPAGADRIQFSFVYKGRRYRLTLRRTPTEANLRRAAAQLKEIKLRIKHGTFDFREEFPDYRFTESLVDESPEESPATRTEPIDLPERERAPEQTCDEVFDAFLAYCEMRVNSNDMAFSTLNSYRKILKRSWRPQLGRRPFRVVRYSELVTIATAQKWKTKKTYNNGVSPLRCAFEFGYKDYPEVANPADRRSRLLPHYEERPTRRSILSRFMKLSKSSKGFI